jgi:hypothetical protein
MTNLDDNSDDYPDLEVRYEPDHEVPMFGLDRRPMLTWGCHPEHGNGWTLSYFEDDSETAGVDDHFIPGDVLDVDYVVQQARSWLRLVAESRESER